jgi:hypothetical protein
LKNPFDRIPCEIGEQPAQTRLGSIEIQVVAEFCSGTQAVNSRLFRIDFPRMEIEYARLSVDRVDAFQTPAR